MEARMTTALLGLNRRAANFSKRLLQNHQGQAVIELALVFGLLVVLLVGAAEYGRIWYYSIAVTSAAEAGAKYGAQSHEISGTPTNVDPTGNIANAAHQDGTDVPGMAVQVAAPWCTCFYVDGSTVANPTCVVPPTSPCVARAAGDLIHSIEYVQVNTSATVTPMFHVPGLPASFTLSGKAVHRVGDN
jgi:hypothetical protein